MKLTKKDRSLACKGYKTLSAKSAKKSVSAKSGRYVARSVGKAAMAKKAPERVALLVSGSPKVQLPPQAVKVLEKTLEYLAEGKEVTVTAQPEELTTQQAADFLRVSRPFLIGLLDKGEIPFRKVGTHRRVLFSDLQRYKEQIDAKRLKTLEELAAQAQELNMGY